MADTRNTLQKEIIHQTLCRMNCHPTASMVYEAVHRTHPTISRSTVFRVLGQMAEVMTVSMAQSAPTAMSGAGAAAPWRISPGSRWPPPATQQAICWRGAQWNTGGCAQSARPG